MTTSQKLLLIASFTCAKKQHIKHETKADRKRNLAKINRMQRDSDGVFDNDVNNGDDPRLLLNAKHMDQKHMEYFELESLLNAYFDIVKSCGVLSDRNKTRVRIGMGSNRHVNTNTTNTHTATNDYACDREMKQKARSLSGNADLLKMVSIDVVWCYIVVC